MSAEYGSSGYDIIRIHFVLVTHRQVPGSVWPERERAAAASLLLFWGGGRTAWPLIRVNKINLLVRVIPRMRFVSFLDRGGSTKNK